MWEVVSHFSEPKKRTWLWFALAHSVLVLAVLLTTDPMPPHLLDELRRPVVDRQFGFEHSCFDCPVIVLDRPLVGHGLAGANRVLAIADLPAVFASEWVMSNSDSGPSGTVGGILFLLAGTAQWTALGLLAQILLKRRRAMEARGSTR